MLYPKKTKFNKYRKGRITGAENKVYNPCFGTFGIKSLTAGRITSQQIESVRKLLVRNMQKSGSISLKIYPSYPVTAKPQEVRMGKGKGSLKYWCFPVKCGRILFEIVGVDILFARKVINIIRSKLPFTIKIVKYI